MRRRWPKRRPDIMTSADGMAIPSWATSVLACPGSRERLVAAGDHLVAPDDRAVADMADGIVRFGLPAHDSGIDYYRAVGGAHFHERSTVPYAMTTLDTPAYHAYLAELRAPDLDGLVVDVGGGDGRNALPWLAWGQRRVVVVEPIRAALERLRARVAQDHPEWLERLLLIEGDARALPLADRCAARVQSIETLYYLNEEYDQGLSECVRLMADDARLLLAERDYEGGLLARLLHGGGIEGMLEQAGTRDVWDGTQGKRVRSRCFTADELAAVVAGHGLRIVSAGGLSVLSMILGYLRAADRLQPDDIARLPAVHALLRELGKTGDMRRTHVVIAERAR
jgi:SAM-dependent methyltransferase